MDPDQTRYRQVLQLLKERSITVDEAAHQINQLMPHPRFISRMRELACLPQHLWRDHARGAIRALETSAYKPPKIVG